MQSAELTPEQQSILRDLAGNMIPAHQDRGLPGADDDLIFKDILASLGRDFVLVEQILKTVRTLLDGQDDSSQKKNEIADVVTHLCSQRPDDARVLERVVTQAYYRDRRVMKIISMPARPPYPKGYQMLTQAPDWDLLEPVIARGIQYRVVE